MNNAALSSLKNMRLISCPYCGRIHPKGQCEIKKTWRTHRATEATEVHHSRQWTVKSLEVRERDGGVCQYCLRVENHIVKDGLSVHHIVPLEEDISKKFDDDNLITLCSKHHKAADDGRLDVEMLKRWATENSKKYF